MMEFGVEWRGISVCPASEDEIADFVAHLDLGGEDSEKAREIARTVTLLGTIRRVATGERLGSVVLMPFSEDGSVWEYSIEVTDPKHRDAFAAVHASDAMAHYMFDHLACDAIFFQIEAKNRAAQAIAKRIGYAPRAQVDVDGEPMIHYVLDGEMWAERREKLERGRRLPSGEPPRFVHIP